MGNATREAYGEALKALGGRCLDVVVLDADLSKSTKTNLFAAAYPERFINAGIAEQNMVGVAAGLAAAGKIPFVSSFAIFASGRAFEQIRNSGCYPKLNVKIAATHAGLSVGEDGASYQAVEDISLMRTIPNMSVIVPADAREAYQAMVFAAEYHGPVYLRLGRMGVPDIFGEDYRFQFGRAVELTGGKDVAILATGVMVAPAMQAAGLLAAEGYAARVLNVHTIKPLDEAAVVRAAEETGAIVTYEEHSVIGGLGSAVAEVLGENAPVPLVRVGVQDCFGESGTPSELFVKYGLTAADIVLNAKRVMSRKKPTGSVRSGGKGL